MNEQRLIDLETKISHQEVAVDGLQQIVYEQQQAIERLESSLKWFVKKFEAMAAGDADIGPANDRPPHY